METTKPIPQESDVEIYIDIYCQLFTLNSTRAAKIADAVIMAITRFTQQTNMPLESCSSHIQQNDCGTFEVKKKKKTEGKKTFQDYKQEYSWKDIVSKNWDRAFVRLKLKSRLLLQSSDTYTSFENFCTYTLRKTNGSDYSTHTTIL